MWGRVCSCARIACIQYVNAVFVASLIAAKMNDKPGDQEFARETAPIWQVKGYVAQSGGHCRAPLTLHTPRLPSGKARLECVGNLPAEKASSDSKSQQSQNQDVKQRV